MARQQRIHPASVASPRNATPKQAKGRSGRPGGRPNAAQVKKASLGDWIGGARLPTLQLAVAPVAIGAAAGYVLRPDDAGPLWGLWRTLLCLAVAVAMQIGVNYANDYSDGVRGTDKHRVGPRRLTGSGAAKPRTVLIVALVFFGLAAAAGLVIVAVTQHWWLIAVGAAAILAGWLYTGGKRPYGYYGLGEVFVFAFFGIVATAGTTFVLVGTVSIESWLGGVATGLLASAVLMINNARDRAQDAVAGKRTLAVLLGDRASRIAYVVLLLAPFGILAFFAVFYANAYLVYFALLAALPAAIIAMTAKTAHEFVIVLRLTTLTALAYGLGVGWAIAF